MFNLGEYRRHATTAYTSHEFFRADNKEAMAIRQQCALDALHDVCEWLVKGGEVAVSIRYFTYYTDPLLHTNTLTKMYRKKIIYLCW